MKPESRTEAAVLTFSHQVLAISLSPKNCVTLKKAADLLADEDVQNIKAADINEPKNTPLTQSVPDKKILWKRRHSSTPTPRSKQGPRPQRNAKSLTEITNTEIIDGLFTTTLCSTEL